MISSELFTEQISRIMSFYKSPSTADDKQSHASYMKEVYRVVGGWDDDKFKKVVNHMVGHLNPMKKPMISAYRESLNLLYKYEDYKEGERRKGWTEQENRTEFEKAIADNPNYLGGMRDFLTKRFQVELSDDADMETVWGCLQFLKNQFKDGSATEMIRRL